MSDHYHYEYAGERHDHRGDYAEAGHDHDGDYAEKHHRHYDDESTARGLREDLSAAEERISDLGEALSRALDRIRALEERDVLDGALDRITALEKQTPQAQRLRYEADLAVADLAESYPWPEDYEREQS